MDGQASLMVTGGSARELWATDQQWVEFISSYLATPSPVCAPFVGLPLNRPVVEPFENRASARSIFRKIDTIDQVGTLFVFVKFRSFGEFCVRDANDGFSHVI